MSAHTWSGVHWVAAGTLLLTGRARVRLAYTGPETLYGEIVRLALQGTHARTPLQAAIGRLVAMLLAAALLMCVVLAVIRLYQGYGIVDALLSAVTLGVAALPEEFPVVFTFFLGAGVYRLAKRQALVRRAVAVENIGRITCICSDKTGTMTEGRLVLAHRAPVSRRGCWSARRAGGAGFAPGQWRPARCGNTRFGAGLDARRVRERSHVPIHGSTAMRDGNLAPDFRRVSGRGQRSAGNRACAQCDHR